MAAGAAFLWSTMGILGKLAYRYGATPLPLVTIRATIATLTLALVLKLIAPRLLHISRKDLLFFAFYGLFGVALNYTCYFYALKYTTVAVAVILLYLYPAIVTVMGALFFRERLDWVKWVALAAALAGCFLVVGGYNPSLLKVNLVGVLFGLGAGLTAAIATLSGKWAVGRYSPWTIVLYACGFGTFFLLLIWGQRLAEAVHYPPMAWLIIALIAWFPTLLAYMLFIASMRYIEASHASITATLEPVMAVALAYFILGETLESLQLLGGVMVLGAILMLSGKTARNQKQDKNSQGVSLA